MFFDTTWLPYLGKINTQLSKLIIAELTMLAILQIHETGQRFYRLGNAGSEKASS